MGSRAEEDHLKIHRMTVEYFAELLPKDIQTEFLDSVRHLVEQYERAMHDTAYAQALNLRSSRTVNDCRRAQSEDASRKRGE